MSAWGSAPLLLVPLLALWLCLVSRGAAAGTACAPCQPELCAPVRCAAPELTARDECDCCESCLSAEGERCGGPRGARCGPGLVCVSQRPAESPPPEAEEEGTGRCVCKEDGAVCGSDGRSYGSVCALHLHSWRALHGGRERVRKVHDGECKLDSEEVYCQYSCAGLHYRDLVEVPVTLANTLHWRLTTERKLLVPDTKELLMQTNVTRDSCQQRKVHVLNPAETKGIFCGAPFSICSIVPAPTIVVPPKKIHNITGSQVYLSCEVKAVPTPIITWKKVTESPKGVKLLEELPGDRVNMAVQVRGGPSKHESTGWVLINPLTKEDEGVYQCHASNMVGETQAEGNIKVLEQSKTKKANFPALEDMK